MQSDSREARTYFERSTFLCAIGRDQTNESIKTHRCEMRIGGHEDYNRLRLQGISKWSELDKGRGSENADEERCWKTSSIGLYIKGLAQKERQSNFTEKQRKKKYRDGFSFAHRRLRGAGASAKRWKERQEGWPILAHKMATRTRKDKSRKEGGTTH